MHLNAHVNQFMNQLGCRASDHIVIAVSGGGDSMALSLLLQQWRETLPDLQRPRLTAVTVDHGLRPESRLEAEYVGNLLAAQQLDHAILRWEYGPTVTSDIQNRARAARYSLLYQFCHHHHARYLVLGHNLEDQVDTFMMRLGKASGLRGLTAMSAITERDAVAILRPLLPFAHDQLLEFLRRQHQPWVEDPSNHRPHYQRTRLRQLHHPLAAAGVTLPHIATSINKLQQQQSYLDHDINQWWQNHVTLNPQGWAELDLVSFLTQPKIIQYHGLQRLLQVISARQYWPRDVEPLLAQMRSRSWSRHLTYHGCKLVKHKTKLYVAKNYRDLLTLETKTITEHHQHLALWDNRWLIDLVDNNIATQLTLKIVGKFNASRWYQQLATTGGERHQLPPLAIAAELPGVFWHDQLWYLPSVPQSPKTDLPLIYNHDHSPIQCKLILKPAL